MLRVVEQQPVSEVLPVLYRAVLDAVAELEALGRRREASQIRTDATTAYSKAWDHHAARRLQTLQVRAARVAGNTRKRRRGSAPRPLGRVIDVGRTTV
jgi:hypothetical protein